MEKVDILLAHEDVQDSFTSGQILMEHLKKIEAAGGKLESYNDALILQLEKKTRQNTLNACRKHMRIVNE